MAVVRWTFYDPGNDETYTVPINPDSGGTPSYRRPMLFQSTAAPDGKTLIFEGRAEVQTLEFSGTILTQAHLEAFVTWWRKKNQVLVTDDLGRQYWVVFQDFEPRRVRVASNPWKHTYTVRAPIVDWPA